MSTLIKIDPSTVVEVDRTKGQVDVRISVYRRADDFLPSMAAVDALIEALELEGDPAT
jgi:hypothetical protein